MRSRYPDIMATARKKAIRDAIERGITVGNDLTVIKPFYPEWIDVTNWAKMIDDVWNTHKWKNMSDANQQNRATLADGKMLVHLGGSLSFDYHLLRMEKEKGGPVSEVEVFKSFYLKKRSLEEASGVNLMDAYMELVVEKYGDVRVNHPFNFDRELWEQARGAKRGRLIGVPATLYAPPTSEPTADQIQRLKDAEERVTQLKREVKEMKEKLTNIEKGYK